jgi:hypothetical protein
MDNSNQESMIMECSDQSMLKLQFGKCTNMPSKNNLKSFILVDLFFFYYFYYLAFIVNCMAHWTEDNTNYLIGRVTTTSNGLPQSQKTNYRCLVFTSSDSNSAEGTSTMNRQARDNNLDFIDLSRYESSTADSSQSSIQLSVSQDEFCRNFGVDEQMSFTFTKVLGSKYHVAPPSITSDEVVHKKRRNVNTSVLLHRKELNLRLSCKFPKWLNKKWHNLKQTKLFTLEYKLDSLIVLDEKNSIVINKYTCSQMKSKKPNHIQAIVKSLNGW